MDWLSAIVLMLSSFTLGAAVGLHLLAPYFRRN